MHEYILALLGGAMIGLAAVALMAIQGSIMGISGIVSRLFSTDTKADPWRVSFIVGVLAAPLAIILISGKSPIVEISSNPALLIVAGLLVGTGTVIGNGCTSGHGVCGLSRFSVRSLVATLVFMVAAVITVFVSNLVIGA